MGTLFFLSDGAPVSLYRFGFVQKHTDVGPAANNI
jgi:hypothetical protein